MKTQFVQFIAYHMAFSHEPGDVVELQEVDAKRAIDLGVAKPTSKSTEKAVAASSASPEQGITTETTEKAIDNVIKQRAEAHGDNLTTVTVGSPLGPVEEPVAIEPSGNKILVKPADEQAVNAPKK